MHFDILLLSVVVAAAYLGPGVLRRQPPGRRGFGWLLVADGAAALVALMAPPGRGADTLGFVAIGAAVCLLVVPPILRDLARRALRADRPGLALRLIGLWDHLQPGMGVARERELIEVLVAVQNGQVEEAVAVLGQARDHLRDPRARRHMDERIVATYLTARRWREAIEVYEDRLASEPPPPQICVELVWAYCESGDLAAAGRMVDRIAAAPDAGEPFWVYLAQRARVMFLAFVGRTVAVEGMLAPGGPLAMLPDASRHFWSGVARLHAGDRGGARADLQRAWRLARGDRRARKVAELIMARIDEPGAAGPHEMSADVAAMADRFSAQAMAAPPVPVRLAPQLGGVSVRAVPVTVGLIVANFAAFAAVFVIFGSTGDPGGLVRAGANVKSWVVARGEWWRLASSMFLHMGFLHLLLNMYGLWILGRLVEQTHGSMRTFAIYMLAGLAGALASAGFGAPGMSAGASGAVLGLLGALIAELALHRDAYPKRWRATLLAPLLFVAAAQVLIGFFYPAIDQWAHVAGLVAGAAGAGLLSRKWAWGTSAAARAMAVVVAGLGALSLVHSAHGIATVRHAEVLARAPRVSYELGGLTFTGPAGLRREGTALVDDVSLWLEAAACPARGAAEAAETNDLCAPGGDRDAQLARAEQVLRASWRDATVRAGDAADDAEPWPEPWRIRVLHITHDGLGGAELYRVAVAARQGAGASGDEIWLVVAQSPEALADDVQPTLTRILASMRAP